MSYEIPLCGPCTAARNAWLDSRPSAVLPTFGFAFGSGAAYDTSVAGVNAARRARYSRWSTLVREQRDAIAAACRNGQHAGGETPVDAPAEPADAFEFARALRDPAVRAHIAVRGYVPGLPVYVGDTPTDPVHGDYAFRVWRDPSVPGGWDGKPVES